MSVAKTVEIISGSPDGLEAAIREGIAKASETIDNIEGAWVKGTKMLVSGGKVTEWRVILAVTFVVK